MKGSRSRDWGFGQRENWLHSPRGLLAQFWRRERVQVYVHAKVEPRSKNSIKDVEKRAFQNALARSLGTRRGFRSPVVVELDLVATAKNPPEIHTVVKNYLDLTHRAPAGKGRLMIDDRQVRHLTVRYFADGAMTTPSIFLRATRVSCFREDVRLARLIGQRDDDTSWSPEDNALDDTLEDLRQWESQHKYIHATYGSNVFELHRRHALAHVQQAWLAGTERQLHSILLDLISGELKTNLSEIDLGGVRMPTIDLEHIQRSLLFTPGISLELGSLPRSKGDSAVFRQSISDALARLRESSPRLFPLLTQLAVTILLVPPKTKDDDQGIDLDNLARRVIPLIHSILEPPGRHPIPDPAMIEDPQLRTWYEAQAIRARHLPKHHVTRYEVIEVPRTTTDPDWGYVRLALCPGNGATFLEYVRDRVEKWKDKLND